MDSSPCIVLATSGMLNGGPVMEYFKNWAHEERNSLCFVGYQAEGTLGRRLQKGFGEVPMLINGKTEIVKIGCEMVTIDGFSGHSDRRQLLDFVDRINPPPKNIICHHGDYQKCNELGLTLRERYNCLTFAPSNLETVRLFWIKAAYPCPWTTGLGAKSVRWKVRWPPLGHLHLQVNRFCRRNLRSSATETSRR